MGVRVETYVRSIRLGAVTVTLINIGYLHADFAEHEPPSDIPIQAALIQTPQTCVVVDACLYETPPDSPYAIPGYQPPPGLLARLAECGVAPAQVAHVIITHAHWDHFNGATVPTGSGYAPSFPNARYHLGRADWDMVQPDIADPNSLASRTLAVLQQSGQLELVTGNYHLTGEIEIFAAPGESPGHQIVRIASDGQTFYCVGDLYHFASEVEYAGDMPFWADRAAMTASRAALVEAALAENALLMVTHVPGLGRLQRTDHGAVWRAE